MPIRSGVESRFPSVGAISVGHQTTSKKGKVHPTTTDTFTFHCDDPDILGVVAEHFGGEVTESPTSSEERERHFLVTDARELVVKLPTADVDRVFQQWYKAYGSSGLIRRCDGLTCDLWRKPPEGDEKVGAISDTPRPCICDAEDITEDKRCSPTVTLDLIVPEIVGDLRRLGVWRLRSTGLFTNAELMGDFEIISSVVGQLGPSVPLLLRVELVNSRRGAKPKISLNLAVSPKEAMELAAGNQAPALLSPTVRELPENEEPVGRIIDTSRAGDEGPEGTTAADTAEEDDGETTSSPPGATTAASSVVIGGVDVPQVGGIRGDAEGAKPIRSAQKTVIFRAGKRVGWSEDEVRGGFCEYVEGDHELDDTSIETAQAFGEWVKTIPVEDSA